MVRVRSATAAIPFKDRTNVPNSGRQNDNKKHPPKGCRVKLAEGEFSTKNPYISILQQPLVGKRNVTIQSDLKLKSQCFVKLTRLQVASGSLAKENQVTAALNRRQINERHCDLKLHAPCFVKLTPLEVTSSKAIEKQSSVRSEENHVNTAKQLENTTESYGKTTRAKQNKEEIVANTNQATVVKKSRRQLGKKAATSTKQKTEARAPKNKRAVARNEDTESIKQMSGARMENQSEVSDKTKINVPSEEGRRKKEEKGVEGVVSSKHDGQTKALNLQESGEIATGEDVVARKLRSLKPINYHDTSPSLNLTKEPENSVHVPIYQQNVEGDTFPKRKNIDVYEFFSDEKEKKKKKKRTSDASFKVKLPRRQKKVTWTKKAEEILERLGLDMTSKTLKEDVQKLIEARNKTNDRTDSSEEQPSNKKINIISHIIIPPSTPSSSIRRESFESGSSDSFLIPSTPVANSTMLDNKVTPWRLPLSARCNPHFLKVKPNALPSVDQEPILDATFTKNAVTKPEEKTSQVQSNILKFVETNKSNSTKNNDASLFDIDEYSPFKNQDENFENVTNNSIETSKREKSRRNLLQDAENCARIENLLDTVPEIKNRTPLLPIENKFKENVLTTNKNTAEHKKFKDDTVPLANKNKYNENSRLVLTENSPNKKPSKQLKKTQNAPLVYNSKRKKNTRKENDENTPPNAQKSSDDLENYFGFTSDVEETLKADKNPKVRKGKPTRIPVVLLVNILKKADESELVFIDEYSRYSRSKEKSLSESESEHESQAEDEESEVPLFMDLKPKMPNRSYQKKIRKDRRRESDALEDESNYAGFKHKDKKAKKEWPEEAEKWAEQFNSMCQNVEDYELEIE